MDVAALVEAVSHLLKQKYYDAPSHFGDLLSRVERDLASPLATPADVSILTALRERMLAYRSSAQQAQSFLGSSARAL